MRVHYNFADRPFPVVDLEEVDSTNLEALRRAAGGDSGPVWIIARRQLAGRGRSGRTWQSVEGNLAATLLISPGCSVADLHQLSLLAGVALHDAVVAICTSRKSQSAPPLRLKWPNDLLCGNAKLAGILIESTTIGADVCAAIGIGLNLAHAPAIDGRATIALGDLVVVGPPSEALRHLEAKLRRWLAVWQAGCGFGEVRAAWLDRAGPLNEPLEINTGSETIRGVFAGIDETGALLVDSVRGHTKEMRRFTFGDVSLMPPKSEGSGNI